MRTNILRAVAVTILLCCCGLIRGQSSQYLVQVSGANTLSTAFTGNAQIDCPAVRTPDGALQKPISMTVSVVKNFIPTVAVYPTDWSIPAPATACSVLYIFPPGSGLTSVKMQWTISASLAKTTVSPAQIETAAATGSGNSGNGGTGASSVSQLTDCQGSVSGQTLSMGVPCTVRLGLGAAATIASLTAKPSVTVSNSHTGNLLVQTDGSTVYVGYTGTLTTSDLSCTNCTLVSVSTWTAGQARIFEWTVTSGALATSATIDGRSLINEMVAPINGTGVLCVPSGNTFQCSIDGSIVTAKFLFTGAAGTNPGAIAGNLPGDMADNTSSGQQYVCMAAAGTAAPACSSITAGGWTLAGGLSGPGSTTVGNVAAWSNTTGSALGTGYPVSTSPGTSTIPETDSSGNLTIGSGGLKIGTHTVVTSSGNLNPVFNIVYSPDNVTCTAGAVTLNSNYVFHSVSLNNQGTCAITWSGGTSGQPAEVILCNPVSGSPTGTITWPANVKNGVSATGGTANTCAVQHFMMGTSNWYGTQPSGWN